MPAFAHLIQLDSQWEDRVASHERAKRLIADAAPSSGDLIVLPEMFSTGFSKNTEVTAQTEAAEDETFLADIALTSRCTVVGGVVSRSDNGGKPFNQSVVFGPDGTLIARYRKQRLFSYTDESSHYQAGTGGSPVFEWNGLQIAPLICYDLRFPELARAAVRAGAEALIYIAAWPVKRQEHWITLLKARAIENQAFVIGVNRCGKEPDSTYGGRSMAVDPHGVVIADAGASETSVGVRIYPNTVAEWRNEFPAVTEFLA